MTEPNAAPPPPKPGTTVAPLFLPVLGLIAAGFNYASGYTAGHGDYQLFGFLALAVGAIMSVAVLLKMLGGLAGKKSVRAHLIGLLVGAPLLYLALHAQTLGALGDLGDRQAALADARALMAHAASTDKASPAPATPALAKGHFAQVEAQPSHVRLRKFSFNGGRDFVGLAIMAPGHAPNTGEHLGDGIYWIVSEYSFTVAAVGSR